MQSLIELKREERANRRFRKVADEIAKAEAERRNLFRVADGDSCVRLVHRGQVRINGKDYWAKELERFDNQTVTVTGIREDGSRYVFVNDDFICSVSQTERSVGSAFAKTPF